MSINPNSVKQYQMIRRYLSLIYLYGFFSREDFQDLLPESAASYDACISLIKDIYPEMHEGRYADSRKYLAVNRKDQQGDLDRLSNTFFLCSLADEELVNVLELLEEANCAPRNKNELANLFDERQSKSTVRRRLDELIDFGYLRQEKKKVAPTENRLRTLSEEELGQLCRYVRFCGNVTFPRVPARFLLRSIEREYLRRGTELPRRQLFQFLHSPDHDVMEEDLIFTLARAIREKRQVTVRMGGRYDPEPRTVMPFRLRVDRRLGRWYLLSMEAQPTIRRLSRLKSVELGAPMDAAVWTALREEVDACFRYSRFSGQIPENGPETVRVKLHFGEKSGLRNQFAREMRGGSIEQTPEGEIFVDTLNDPVELIPLLRSYSPWLEPEDRDSVLAERIRNDLLEYREFLTEEAEP